MSLKQSHGHNTKHSAGHRNDQLMISNVCEKGHWSRKFRYRRTEASPGDRCCHGNSLEEDAGPIPSGEAVDHSIRHSP